MSAGPGWQQAAPVAADDLRGPVEEVAPRLLGTFLAVGTGEDLVVVRVDEVEAYAGPGQDPGSHAHRGPTRRNASMFGAPGSLYVYFTYGMHWCANVVAHEESGGAGAVLLRSGEVVQGVAVARRRRPAARRDPDLARGPARLTQAVALTGEHDGIDLTDPASTVRLLRGTAPANVARGPRVGVAGGGAATPWRWWDAHGGTVSAYRAAQPRRRSAPTRRPPAPSAQPADGTGTSQEEHT